MDGVGDNSNDFGLVVRQQLRGLFQTALGIGASFSVTVAFKVNTPTASRIVLELRYGGTEIIQPEILDGSLLIRNGVCLFNFRV